jgi:hypothetical protein
MLARKSTYNEELVNIVNAMRLNKTISIYAIDKWKVIIKDRDKKLLNAKTIRDRNRLLESNLSKSLHNSPH